MSAAIGGQQRSTVPFGFRTADPRNFGAKCDGITDDTLAWQAAIDSLNANAPGPGSQNTVPGRVLVPSGISLITSPIFLDVSNVELIGEGQSVSRIIGGEGAICTAFPLLMWGFKRVTNWQDDPFNLPPSPIFSQPGIPTVFDAPGAATKYLHRLPCTGNTAPIGNMDSSMAGRFAIKSRPTANFDGTYTNPIPPDHQAMFIGGPFQCGPKDNWMTTRKLCIQSAFQYQPNTAMPAGLTFYGHGSIIDGFGAMGTFGLITDASSPPRFAFKFQTNEFPNIDRVIYFGDTTQTGIQKLCVQIDLTTNGTDVDSYGNPILKVYASQNGQQVAVTRGPGANVALSQQNIIINNSNAGSYTFTVNNPLAHTQATSPAISSATTMPGTIQTFFDGVFGAGNTQLVAGSRWDNWTVQFKGTAIAVNVPTISVDGTNLVGPQNNAILVNPGFSAAQGMHLKKNDVYPFDIFGDAQSYMATTHKPMADLICFGLLMSNDWVYDDQSGVGPLPQPEHRHDGLPQFDGQRYLDNTSASTIACLGLNDQINEPTRNSNKFIRVYHGPAASGFASFGWFFPPDITVNDTFQTVTNTAIRNLRLESTGNWGTCAFASVPTYQQIDSCCLAGGWEGLTASGYDWKITGQCRIYGGHAWISLYQGAMYADHLARSDVGHYAIFLSGGNFECHQIFSGSMNGFGGMPTRSLIRQDNTGNYGNRLWVENIETDNEVTYPTLVALIDVDYVNETLSPNMVNISRISTGKIGGAPVLKLNKGDIAGPTNLDAFINGIANVKEIIAADGFLIQSDSPAWDIFFEDTTPWWPLREVYRNVGIAKPNSIHYEYTPYTFPTDPNATPPPAGRWIQGFKINVRNPAPGAVAQWICTTSGTGAWSSTHQYYPFEIAQKGGVEYIVPGNKQPTVGENPATSPNWVRTTDGYGYTTSPVFKAVSTVAP